LGIKGKIPQNTGGSMGDRLGKKKDALDPGRPDPGLSPSGADKNAISALPAGSFL